MPEETTTLVRMRVNNRECEIDLESLTYGEIEVVEDFFACSLAEVPWNSGKADLMLAYLALHRRDPGATLDTIRGLRPDQVEVIEDEEGSERPTQDGSGEPGTPSTESS